VRDTELALVAEVRKPGQVADRKPFHLAVHFGAVERPEQDVEGRAQVVAAAARVADVGDAPKLRLDRRRVEEVVGGGVEHAFPLDSVGAEVVEALLEAAGVRLLRARERLEPLRDFGEALLARRPRETRVHLGVLVGLPIDRGLEV
jgi:hypothetical protein